MQNSQLTRRNFLLKLSGAVGLVSSPLLIGDLFAAPAGKLTGAKLSGSGNTLDVSFILSAAVKHKVFTLKAPDRVVIDLMQTTMSGNLKQGEHNRPPLKGLRYATHADGYLRIVLDLSQKVTLSSAMSSNGGQHILKISLKTNGVPKTSKKAPAKKPVPARNVSPQPSRAGNFVVVIDPGHGGRDPGAVGKRGTREKDVVLSVARKLKARIDATRGMRAIMTRGGDKYVPLRKRIEIARKNRADLFISVHADANHSSRLHGSSVYILSQNGASSEAARLLAKSENSYEQKLGNVHLAKNNDNVASILLDLSQNETLDRSLDLANSTLKELARISNPLRRKVESASFVVLKAPDIPSMLVETAFISNPQEEKRLRTPAYQQKLADAMFRGVKQYQRAHAPGAASQQYAASPAEESSVNRYTVRSGDSLSVIADRHGVSVRAIKQANKLNSTSIRAGQKLRIPAST